MKKKEGVGYKKQYDRNCPRCKLQPIVFDHEKDPICQFCGAKLIKVRSS